MSGSSTRFAFREVSMIGEQNQNPRKNQGY